ncbi:DUF305 domain-containing protein [Pedobacter sp. P351]|uniref:DUF305 domain-containing protein n=1 Tax=Pedobacter superstes TaxID=3133441 RepID=UPI00309B986C
MKTSKLLIGTFALALSISACQNKSTTSETGDSTMDMSSDSSHNMGSTESKSSIMGGMDKMMTDMHQMEMTGNVDVDFAMMMKGHHQGAVDMAQAQLSSGSDAKLKEMAQKIVDAQQSEIAELDKFLEANKSAAKNYDPMDKEKGFGKIMDKNMSMMMDMPKTEGDSPDKQFVQMMIPHHQSAVYMAEGFLQSGKDPMLISMAKKMIADQNKEIEEFKKWTE